MVSRAGVEPARRGKSLDGFVNENISESEARDHLLDRAYRKFFQKQHWTKRRRMQLASSHDQAKDRNHLHNLYSTPELSRGLLLFMLFNLRHDLFQFRVLS